MKTRAEELVTLADAINILNDYDALGLFKKTLPSTSASLVVLKQTIAVIQARALEMMYEPPGGERRCMNLQAGTSSPSSVSASMN